MGLFRLIVRRVQRPNRLRRCMECGQRFHPSWAVEGDFCSRRCADAYDPAGAAW